MEDIIKKYDTFCAPYFFKNKPVKKCFALVECYLNELDTNAPEALDNPHQVLSAIFYQWSTS